MATTNAWMAQRWSIVKHDGKECILVERNKENRKWSAMESLTKEMTEIPADAQVEIVGVQNKKFYRMMIGKVG